jgi:hypothetical protein
MTTPPERTDQERHDALERGMEVRKLRSQMKKDITSGTLDPVSVIEAGKYGQTSIVEGRTPIADVLEAIDGIGPVKTAEILKAAGIENPDTHVAELTQAQRDSIAEALYE